MVYRRRRICATEDPGSRCSAMRLTKRPKSPENEDHSFLFCVQIWKRRVILFLARDNFLVVLARLQNSTSFVIARDKGSYEMNKRVKKRNLCYVIRGKLTWLLAVEWPFVSSTEDISESLDFVILFRLPDSRTQSVGRRTFIMGTQDGPSWLADDVLGSNMAHFEIYRQKNIFSKKNRWNFWSDQKFLESISPKFWQSLPNFNSFLRQLGSKAVDGSFKWSHAAVRRV